MWVVLYGVTAPQSVQYLVSMGFSEALASKAVLFTRNTEDAVQYAIDRKTV